MASDTPFPQMNIGASPWCSSFSAGRGLGAIDWPKAALVPSASTSPVSSFTFDTLKQLTRDKDTSKLLSKIVNLHQTYAGDVVLARQQSRVTSGRKRDGYPGLQVMRCRQARGRH